jgi:hypothetical protein
MDGVWWKPNIKRKHAERTPESVALGTRRISGMTTTLQKSYKLDSSTGSEEWSEYGYSLILPKGILIDWLYGKILFIDPDHD